MEGIADLDTLGSSCSNRENLQANQNNSRNESRPVSGLLTSYHGVAYQVQWNMVVALEAKERWVMSEKAKSEFTFKIKDFKTEDPDAGKFDDVVWRYEIECNRSPTEDRYEYNFLQAKHKLNKDEKVSFNELVKPKQKKEPLKKHEGVDKRPFALEKYFISYRDKIKKGKRCENGHMGKLIIATNIDLHKDLKDNLLSPVKDVPLLDLIESETNKKPDIWKIDRIGSHYKKIVEQLQGTYDSVTLAKELVESVLNNKVITEKSFISSYLSDFKKNEIIDKCGKLTQIFLENSEKLNQKAKEFRRLLLKVGFEDKQPSFNNDYQISEPDKFANEIAILISSSAGINREVKIRRKLVTEKNINKLANYVFIEDDNNRVKFSLIFWEKNENALPGNLGEFREQLKCKLVQHSVVDQQDEPAVIAEKLQAYHFKITKFNTCNENLVDKKSFWKAMKKGAIKGNIGAVSSFSNILPMEMIEDIQKDINEFFGNFRFVINYSQSDLDEFVKRKCKKFTGFVNDFVAYKFQMNIGNTLNLANEDFISDSKQVDRFFKESQKQLEALTLIGLTLEYRAKIKLYGLEFSAISAEDLLKLENESELFLDSNKQILNLITDQKDLTCIKFIQALEARSEYKRHGNYASLSLNSALLLQNFVIEAFESESNNLLLIKSEAVEQNMNNLHFFELFLGLSGVLKSNRSKKIILITKEKEDLATIFKDRFPDKYEEKRDNKIGLIDLTDECQEKISKERTLIFQGKETTLGVLLFNKELKRLVNGDVLFDIVESKRISIGGRLPSISDGNSPAYFKVMEVMKKIDHLKDVEDIFVISGLDRDSLIRKLKLEESKVTVANKEIILFQDKSFQFVVLGSDSDKNVNDFEDVCRQFQESLSTELTEKQKKRLIHLIEFDNGEFVWNRYYDPNFYIDRYFNKILIDEKFIEDYLKKRMCVKNTFIFGKIQKDDFIKRYGISEKQVASTLVELDREGPIFILSRDHEEEEAQQTFKVLPRDCNFHWLEINGNNFIWKRSNCEIEIISQFRRNSFNPENCNEIHESELEDGKKIYEKELVNAIKNERFVVLADVPGMGKSTTLSSLSKAYKKGNLLDWVVKVNLRDCEGTIDKNLRDFKDSVYNKHKKSTIGRIVNFLSETDQEGFEHPLAKELLRHKLFTNVDSGILLLLDGFDEIRENKELRQKKICNLLKFLKENTNVKVVITTRPYEQETKELENAFSVLSHAFSPIADLHGQKFIERLWQNSLKLVYSQNELHVSYLSTFVTVLHDKCRKVFESLSSFVGVPLQLQMLAEAYLESAKYFVKNKERDETSVEKLLGVLNFNSLYKRFTAKKYDIYFQEKNRFSESLTDSDIKERAVESYEQDHKRLAFLYIVCESSKSHNKFFGLFYPDKISITSRRLKNLNKVGIIHSQKSYRCDFVHRTFAEYYVSELIYDRFQKITRNPMYSQESKKKMWEFLFRHVFLNDNYNVIRNFINCKLTSDPLFVDFESNFVEHKSIVYDLLEKTVGDREISVTKLLKPMRTLTPLEVVSFEGLSEIVEFILKIAPSNYIMRTHFPEHHLRSSDDSNAWELAIMYNRLNVIKVLLKFAKKICKCQDFLDMEYHTMKYRSIDSPLHYAVLNSSLEMVECFVERGACIQSKVDKYPLRKHRTFKLPRLRQIYAGFTPLHCAFMAMTSINESNGNDRLKKIQYLLENGSEINAKDEAGNTPLHLACVGSLNRSIHFIIRNQISGDFDYTGIWRGQSFLSSLRTVIRFTTPEILEKMIKLLITKLQHLECISPKDRGMSVSNFINAVNDQGFTAIFLAAAGGLWKIVDYLMSNADSVDISRNLYGTTTLHCLAAEAKDDLLSMMEDFLRKSGIDVNVKTTELPESESRGYMSTESESECTDCEIPGIINSDGTDVPSDCNIKTSKLPESESTESKSEYADCEIPGIINSDGTDIAKGGNIKTTKLSESESTECKSTESKSEYGDCQIPGIVNSDGTDVASEGNIKTTKLPDSESTECKFTESKSEYADCEIQGIINSDGTNVAKGDDIKTTKLSESESTECKSTESKSEYADCQIPGIINSDGTDVASEGNVKTTELPESEHTEYQFRSRNSTKVTDLSEYNEFGIRDIITSVATDVVGETPLHWAAKNNNVEAVKILLSFVADKNAKNSEGQTALDLCQNPTIIRLIKRWTF